MHACASGGDDWLQGVVDDLEEEEDLDEDEDVTHTCQFCGKYDPSFTDQELDMHYWQSCPMLMSCEECGQVGCCQGGREGRVRLMFRVDGIYVQRQRSIKKFDGGRAPIKACT